MLIDFNINIPPFECYPCYISYIKNWVLFNKFSYVEYIRNQDEICRLLQLSALYISNRIRTIYIILNTIVIDAIIKLIHTKISLKEKYSFIVNHY